MKKIIVACDSDFITSQKIATKLEFLLQENGYGKLAKVLPIHFVDLKDEVAKSDILVAVGESVRRKRIKIPILDGYEVLNPHTQKLLLNKIVKLLKNEVDD